MKSTLFKIASIFFLILFTTHQAEAFIGGPWAGWNAGSGTFVDNNSGTTWYVEAGVFPTYLPGDRIYPGVQSFYDCGGTWCGPMYIGGLISSDSVDGVNFGVQPAYLVAPLTLGPHTASFNFGIGVINVPFTVVPQTGYIQVVPSITTGASWTITGPTTLSGSGYVVTYSTLPSGSYTITWNDVAGYTKPATQTLTLVAPSTIYFYGTYVVSAPVVTPVCGATHNNCTVGTVGATATYVDRWQWWCNGSTLPANAVPNLLCQEMMPVINLWFTP
jgi:hypothetical protein